MSKFKKFWDFQWGIYGEKQLFQMCIGSGYVHIYVYGDLELDVMTLEYSILWKAIIISGIFKLNILVDY